MHIEQRIWTPEGMWQTIRADRRQRSTYQLVFVFSNHHLINSPGIYEEIRSTYPKADIIIIPATGEIMNDKISEKTLALTALEWEDSTCRTFSFPSQAELTEEAYEKSTGFSCDLNSGGELLVISAEEPGKTSLFTEKLKQYAGHKFHISILNTGSGSGMKSGFIGVNQNPIPGQYAVVELNGENLTIGQKQVSICEINSSTYKITKAAGNTIYELEDLPALQCFRKHLPNRLASQFGSYLLPSMNLRLGNAYNTMAQIHQIDEDEQSITLLQKVDERMELTIHQSNPGNLQKDLHTSPNTKEFYGNINDFSIIQSSIQRKIILGPYAQKELEMLKDNLGKDSAMAGFYTGNEEGINETVKTANYQHYTITTIGEKNN